MALFNYAAKEITLKIVYYGPGLCGKTTNLQQLHTKLSTEKRSKLLSLSTESDRTLFFDFMPVALGKIKDFDIKFQLYTVPGQVRYNATRKLVLKGADAVVFVADSQTAMKDANIDSLHNMKDNLIANNISPDDTPVVFQYNKRDLDDIMPVGELDRVLNLAGDPAMEASAINGNGVEETFKMITRRLLKYISKKHNVQIEATPEDFAEPKEKGHVPEKAGAEDKVVNIQVQEKPDESEVEKTLLMASIPEPAAVEVEPTEWSTSPEEKELGIPSVEEPAGKTGDSISEGVAELLQAAPYSEESPMAGGPSEMLMKILHEIKESRKQQAEILAALRKIFSEKNI
jgi:small GTP-binding protein